MMSWGLSGVTDLLRRTGWLWWRCWPWLIAIYLTGWLARYWSVRLAAACAIHFGGFWGDLLLPLATLVRLITYVLMFLVLRSQTDLDTGDTGESRFEAFVGILLRAILPVFVLLAAWQVPRSDEVFYRNLQTLVTSTAADHSQDGGYLTAGDWRAYVAIAVAFVARWVLTRYAEKLPAWTQLIAVYLQALWVLLLLNAASSRLVLSPAWIKERRIIAWYTDQKHQVLSHFGVFAEAWRWCADTVGLVVLATLLSATWIAIAGTVYTVRPETTWSGAGRAAFGQERGDRIAASASQAVERAAQWWRRLPHLVQSRGSEMLQSLLGIAEKLMDTIRLVLHAGPVTGCFYVFAFMALVVLDPNGAYFNPTVSDGQLWRWTAEVIGPHEWSSAFDWESVRLLISAAVDPLRVCLVAAMYWHCVERVSRTAVTTEP